MAQLFAYLKIKNWQLELEFLFYFYQNKNNKV